uniref:Nuclear transcription factor Y subunit n=1 Tax=Datisca glomerata TaxID=34297 RepID=A0A6M3RDX1_DATGL|nr:transcription factor [Datisca glomerata]
MLAIAHYTKELHETQSPLVGLVSASFLQFDSAAPPPPSSSSSSSSTVLLLSQMAMQTVYLKEHEGIMCNSIGQLASSNPWWSSFGSPSVYGGDTWTQFKAFSVDPYSTEGEQLTPSKQAQGFSKGCVTPFTIFPGDGKSAEDAQKAPAAILLQSSLPEYHSHFELGLGQPLNCGKYPSVDQCYGIFSTYGPQISGRIMLPWSLTTEDGPLYVNAKQYHRIVKRRQTRAKAVIGNRVTKVRKPYMHESRHLHAIRRPRGCGGRFLNTKTLKNGKTGPELKKSDTGKFSPSTGSQSSTVLQSDSGTLNSSKEMNGSSGSNLSGSEVTSMYTKGDFDFFNINHLGQSVHSLSDLMDTGHGLVMPPHRWVMAADDCCHLRV